MRNADKIFLDALSDIALAIAEIQKDPKGFLKTVEKVNGISESQRIEVLKAQNIIDTAAQIQENFDKQRKELAGIEVSKIEAKNLIAEAQSKEKDIQKMMGALGDKESSLKKAEAELTKERNALAAREAAVSKKESSLDSREEAIISQEKIIKEKAEKIKSLVG